MRPLRTYATAAVLLLAAASARAGDPEPAEDPPPILYGEDIPVDTKDPEPMLVVAYLDKTAEGEKFRRSLAGNMRGNIESYLAKHPDERADPSIAERRLTKEPQEWLKGQRAKQNPQPPPAPKPVPQDAAAPVPPPVATPPPAADPGAAPGMYESAPGIGDGAAGGKAADESVSETADPRGAVGGRGGAAAARAKSMAEGMKSTLANPDSLGGAGGPAGAKPGAPGAGPAPAGVADLTIASSAHAATFESLGLKMGRGPDGRDAVLRRDGAPASAAEIAGLRSAIASQPAALARNPGYLDPARGGIAPSDYSALKRDYAAHPELRGKDFKDIALKSDKDFQYDKSCDRISGACNKHAEKSYAKGEDVSARSLKSIRASIKDYLAKASKSGLLNDGGAPSDVRRRQNAGVSRLRGLLERMLSGGKERAPLDAAAREDGAPPPPGAAEPAVAAGAAPATADTADGTDRAADDGAAGEPSPAGRGPDAGYIAFGVLGAGLLAGGAWVLFARGPRSPVGRGGDS